MKANSNNTTSKVQLSPISSNVSFGGTTVSYGILGDGGSSINDFNNQGATSANWNNNSANWANTSANWNNNSANWGNTSANWGNGQVTNQWQQSTGAYPTVSAANYNQTASGMYDYGNQHNQYGSQYSNQYGQLNYVKKFNQGQSLQPNVDISETSNDIVISAYVSNGIMNDISLNVSEDSVTISGSVWNGNEGVALRRIIPLATSVRAEVCDASLQSGTLEIRLPKTEKSNRNKTTLLKDTANVK